MFIGPCSIKILAGSGHPQLAQDIAGHLDIKPAAVLAYRQPSGETLVTVGECLRDQDIYICQTGHGSVNDALMELLIMISAAKAASARRITVVMPCFPYARQDKKTKARCPITAKLVANLITKAGADHIITMDLHAQQIKGFFRDIPVDNLLAEPLMLQYVRDNIPEYKKTVIVSPDAGGVKRATSIADELGCDFAIIHKEREMANHVSRMVLVGHVQGRTCLLVDDMADTCGTLCKAADTLHAHGAREVYALVVHPILSGPALQRISESRIKALVVCNTVPMGEATQACGKIHVIGVGGIFAEAIRRSHLGQSMSFLFKHASLE